jgi:DUF4097 and DUF4098 domain-containing protein YvlB
MRFERYDTPGATTVQVTVYSADISVSTWDAAATEIEVDGRRDDDATRAALDGFKLELHERSGGHEVVVRESKKAHFGIRLRDPGVNVRIRCPHGTALTVSSGSSDLRGDGTLGAVEVKTGSGDTSLEGSVASLRVTSASGDVRAATVLGQATLTSASGDVRLDRVEGELGANTVSGDLEIGAAAGETRAQSVSGDIELVALGGGDIRVQTVSGDVNVGLASGVAVWIDAGSVSGDVTSSLEVGDAPSGAGERVVELRVKSVSGDVSIGRAKVAVS